MGAGSNRTVAERTSAFDLVVTRTFNAPVHVVFEAWTKPDLFKLWWAPKSTGMSILTCAMDVRVGGGYRIEFPNPGSGAPIAFFGRYLDVVPNARLVWTNEESEGGPVTTVTFEATPEGGTRLVLHERHATKDSLDALDGMEAATAEQFEQLDALLATLAG